MTNQQILERAIQKAVDNGYLYPNNTKDTKYYDDMPGRQITFAGYISGRLEDNPENEVYPVIFDKDFAKALWGEWDGRCICGNDGKTKHSLVGAHGMTPDWKSHLRGMVIADDPIKYLGDNT